MSGNYLNIPGTLGSGGSAGASFWKNPVADVASLPPSGNATGDTRITLDTFSAYTWNGATWELTNAAGSGGGSPAGPNGAVQFNDSGAFAGDSNLTYDGTNLSTLAIISLTSDPASAGFLRLANNQSLNWRNKNNDGDLGISLTTADKLGLGMNFSQSTQESIVSSEGVLLNNLYAQVLNIDTPVTGTEVLFNIYSNNVIATDDYTSSLGYGLVGSASSAALYVAAGKTVDLVQANIANISIINGSPGGSVTTAYQYNAYGILNQGGTLNIGTCIAYYIGAGNSSGATNMWGLKDDSTAENNLNRLAINTSTQKVSTGTTGLEINDKDLVLTGTSNVRISGNLGVGNSAAATTPGTVQRKIEIFDASGASLGFIAVYDSIT